MNFVQKEINLTPKERGFHLVTREIIKKLPELYEFSLGIAHIFICNTSTSLTINENASPEVREDFESHFYETVPEDARYYLHAIEGSDDMPAHIKASILGSSVTVPVKEGRFNIDT
jgi:secondary thiamine-phosphate synthase enzyme